MLNGLKRAVFKYLYKGNYKPGHYYSPIPDLNELESRAEQIFETQINKIPGIDLNLLEQKELQQSFNDLLDELLVFNPADRKLRYYNNNNFFSLTDAAILELILTKFKPSRIIEVGSGFSSAVMLDTNEYKFNNQIELNFIEPYPDRLNQLLKGADEKARIFKTFVQDMPLETFTQLKENDILFIDSSHVSKIGSDVNHIIFKILPKLKPGVIIHFHDILFPFEYPKSWVMDGIYWNEAYVLKSFLMFNQSFKIIFFNNYFTGSDREWIRSIPPIESIDGGSIWLQKV